MIYFLLDGGRKFHGGVFLHGPEDNRRDLTPAQLVDLFPDLTGPLVGLTEVMKSNPESYYTNIYEAVAPEWTRNRVAIAGDAAHAMSPVLGQGAGAGFEDAAVLVDLLTAPHLPVPQAFASYENFRRPVAQGLQRLALATSEAMSTSSSPNEIFAKFGDLPGRV
jgi:FAD-dependent urate hydroxylase